MTELKESRWVKVHEQGQGSFDTKENVMDISIGAKQCKAEVVYTVSSIRKAVGWTLTYLEAADAKGLLEAIADSVRTAAEKNEDIDLQEDNWNLHVETMQKGVFNVQLNWTPAEPVTKKPKKNRKAAEKKDEAAKPARKKRAAKKNNETAIAEDAQV